jgi:flavorubredoxin/rubredoxin
MHCTKRITNDLTWVGANDRRLAMFEGVYSVPDGVSYNSYLLTDDKTVLFDTVDKAVRDRFFENLTYALGGRKLDYVIVQHMEPDHSAALGDLLVKYPDLKVICNAKTLDFIKQFHDFEIDSRVQVVTEKDTLNTGRHELHFVMAPMVHWPEVMVTYDSEDKILFSADGFGCFGALNGAIFADEVHFSRDYMDEARRYYTSIVGKYGAQVAALLDKAGALEIDIICPLHGFVWRKNLSEIISKYALWSAYEPEEQGVMIAYASVYGNTENAAEILSAKLRDKGIKTVMFDVSVTPASEIVSASFKWSHLVFASTTYNAGIFVSMEAFLHDLTSHNIQNRTVAIIENGSWAAASGGLIREKLAKCKNMKILESTLSIKSSLQAAQLPELDAMVAAITATFPKPEILNDNAMFKIPSGLYLLTAKAGKKDNGCIINTVMQITNTPNCIAIAVNKSGFTHEMIIKTGEFNVCILNEGVPFDVLGSFGFQSGKDTDKFAAYSGGGSNERTKNGIRYLKENINAVISARVIEAYDYSTHTLFTAEVTEALIFSSEPSVTYQHYLSNKKPKSIKEKKGGSGMKLVCDVCGYVYEEEAPMPDDYTCPLCHVGKDRFSEE